MFVLVQVRENFCFDQLEHSVSFVIGRHSIGGDPEGNSWGWSAGVPLLDSRFLHGTAGALLHGGFDRNHDGPSVPVINNCHDAVSHTP